MVFWVDFWPHLSASKPLLCLLLLFYWGVMKICYKLSLSSVCGRLSQKNEPFCSLAPVQMAKCFFPIASLMGHDNGSGMLSAHAGDASAFVQHTCVVGTRPLLSTAQPAPGSGEPLLHLSLALEATAPSEDRA